MYTIIGGTLSNVDRINNEYIIIKQLEDEDRNWQQIVYDATGIYVSYVPCGDSGWIRLISNCGYIDFDSIFDEKSDTKLSQIAEMIDYLSQDNENLNCIKDASVNDYKKSDVFWLLYDCVILPKRLTGQREKFNPPIEQEDGTQYFAQDDYYIRNIFIEDGKIKWDYDLIDYTDNFGEIEYDKISLEECVRLIASEMEELVKTINESDKRISDSYVAFVPDFSRKRKVPTSLEELRCRFEELNIMD